jgi:hypothetical protein
MLSLLVVTIGLLLPQTPAQTPSPAPATQVSGVKEDPAVTALALKIYGQMRKGKVDESLLTEQMNKGLSPSVLAQTKPMFDQLGDPVKLTLESSVKSAAGTTWVYLAEFATAQLHVHIYVMTNGKVGGYQLAP